MGTSSSHPSCCDQPPGSPDPAPSKWSRAWEMWGSSILSLLTLILAVGGEKLFPHQLFSISSWLPLYLLAYALVGWPVLKKAGELAFQGEIFTEFF